MQITLNCQPPKLGIWKHILAVISIISIVIFLFGCKSAERLERKALDPYKKVVADSDSSFKDKKLELGAKYCNDKFPSTEKIVIKDSIVKQVIKVQDNAAIRNLRQQLLDAQKKGCPTFNIDSIVESLDIEPEIRYKTTTTTVKDTVGNWRIGKELQQAKDDLWSAQNNFKIATESFNESEKEKKELIAKQGTWKFLLNGIWDKLKWWLMVIGLLFVVYKFIKLYTKISLPF